MTEFTFQKAEIKQLISGEYEVNITVPKEQKGAVEKLSGMLSGNPIMTAKVDKKRKKRSLDANAYLWVLCDRIAATIGSTKVEVYRNAIKDAGPFEIIPIRKDAVDKWIRTWESRGLGWYAEKMDGCKIDGYEKTINYYGSSVYNTKDMSRLLDCIVEEAKELGIPTETPEEIARLKCMWKGKD